MEHLADNLVLSADTVVQRFNQRRRRLSLSFLCPSDADLAVARDEIHGRCHGSLWPAVLAPLADADIVFGRMEDGWAAARLWRGENGGVWEDQVTLTEATLPRVTP